MQLCKQLGILERHVCMALVRFVIGKLDEDSRRRQGVFHAFGDLRDGGSLYWYEAELATEV